MKLNSGFLFPLRRTEMIDQQLWSMGRAAGLFLVLGSAANVAGVLMFWIRGGASGGSPPSPAYYLWERSFIMAAVILTAIGFVLLEGQLQNTSSRVWARAGATAYLIAGILGIAAEALELTWRGQSFYPLIVVYVVLAFLAQLAIGGSLLQVGSVAAWLGWVTILWNIAWLVVLPLTTSRDIYFPVLHHVMPLLVGSALLWKTP
jgi:hypothetical protein